MTWVDPLVNFDLLVVFKTLDVLVQQDLFERQKFLVSRDQTISKACTDVIPHRMRFRIEIEAVLTFYLDEAWLIDF